MTNRALANVKRVDLLCYHDYQTFLEIQKHITMQTHGHKVTTQAVKE